MTNLKRGENMQKTKEELAFLKKACQYIQNYSKFEDEKTQQLSIEKVQEIAIDFLGTIDKSYKRLLEEAIKEENSEKPILYILNNEKSIMTNHSSCSYNQVYLYPTGTIEDVYLLIHEFTHLLTNRKLKYGQPIINNRQYREIPSILSEFLVKEYLDNKGYFTRNRFNQIIGDSKSYLYKNELHKLWIEKFDTRKEQKELIKKYNITREELQDDIWNPQSLGTFEEKKYILGYLYAIKLWKNNSIDNYIEIINQLQNQKNIISLELLSNEESENLIETAYQFCKKR